MARKFAGDLASCRVSNFRRLAVSGSILAPYLFEVHFAQKAEAGVESHARNASMVSSAFDVLVER